jgi:alginate O-acetyltransferase complex protein AlgI
MLVGWVFFYNTDISQAIKYIGVMFGINAASFSDPILSILFMNNALFILIALLCCLPVGKFLKTQADRLERRIFGGKTDILNRLLIPVLNIALLALSVIFLVGDTYTPFLYFNF